MAVLFGDFFFRAFSCATATRLAQSFGSQSCVSAAETENERADQKSETQRTAAALPEALLQRAVLKEIKPPKLHKSEDVLNVPNRVV